MYNEIDLDKIDINSEPPTEEPARQYYFMAKCRGWVQEFKKKNGRCPFFFTQTFGCQMNARDSEKICGILETIGYVQTDEEEADLVLYNTCTVRENANNKIYGRLGYLNGYKKKNPDMKIALCGCMMQEKGPVEKITKSYPFVDIIFGTHNFFKFAELLVQSFETGQTVVDIWEDTEKIVEKLPTVRKFPFKSGVNIMFGCNNFCSYCIVPYVRGRERSRKPEEILSEIRSLAADGVVEIMLLGQNVNSYGKTLDNPISFAELLKEVEKISGIERIRFMTSHPKDLSDELIEVMKNSSKICHHLHLPVQSGSTRLLEKMNRKYTKEEYLSLVGKLRKAIPDIAITTDIIVGFPGETEQDFEETMDVVRKADYDSAFTFIYSKRTGTPAASYEDQVPEHMVKERFDRLLKEVQEIAARKSMQLEGKVEKVLFEHQNEQDEALITGRLSNNSVVHVKGSVELIGKIRDVKLTECKGFYYYGELYGHA
ncbi:MAG: tRNA (N6-isopentenyl adenosine(37)-C2)-methylthiotransferase MiaB [Eubacterium sp.]|nr:tRNA (N6-isopentenyl adenosine(37)-C2)-methylthiotransferase MiaB [Eubacterium sp.]